MGRGGGSVWEEPIEDAACDDGGDIGSCGGRVRRGRAQGVAAIIVLKGKKRARTPYLTRLDGLMRTYGCMGVLYFTQKN